MQEWLTRPGCRIEPGIFIRLFLMAADLNLIERLWGRMYINVTHNKCCHRKLAPQFADATLSFLREKVPRNWADLC